MAQTDFCITVEIAAPPSLVWRVMSDVERWPEWTASVQRLTLLTPGPLNISSVARIRQPGFPPARWRVTELEAGKGFTWVSTSPGIRVTARHHIEPLTDGSRVALAVCYERWFGRWLARWTHDTTERFLAMEAAGLKKRCLETRR